MRPLRTKLLSLLPVLMFVASPLAAQEPPQKYVSDQLEITFRTGPGTQYSIRRMLKSGTPLVVVEETAEGYTRAQTADGTTGWVLSRFLTDEPVARDRLEQNEKAMEDMRRQNALVQERLLGLQQLEDNLSRVQEENRQLQEEVKRLREVAADSLNIIEKNESLVQELEESRKKQQTLVEDNVRLSDESTQNWFLIGAGVLILGMLIGLTIPNVHWKKRRTSTGGINVDF